MVVNIEEVVWKWEIVHQLVGHIEKILKSCDLVDLFLPDWVPPVFPDHFLPTFPQIPSPTNTTQNVSLPFHDEKAGHNVKQLLTKCFGPQDRAHSAATTRSPSSWSSALQTRFDTSPALYIWLLLTVSKFDYYLLS